MLRWSKNEHTELAALMAADKASVAVLPQPFVTTVTSANADVRVALDLTKEWENVNHTTLTMGCLVVRTEFLENNQPAVEQFLSAYKESAKKAVSDVEGTAKLAEEFDIIKRKPSPKSDSGFVTLFIDGQDMKTKAIGFFNVLHQANPSLSEVKCRMKTSTISTSKCRKRLEKIGIAIVWIAIWQLCYWIVKQELLLASPFSVLKRLGELMIQSEFWKTVAISCLHIFTGFILGLFLGVLFAVLSAKYALFCSFLSPVMTIVKATPVASFIILALIWIQSARLSVFISFLLILPLVYTNTLQVFGKPI